MQLKALFQKNRLVCCRSFLLIFSVSFVATVSIPANVNAQLPSELTSAIPQELIVGVRTDAAAVGSFVTANSSGGACGVFGEELARVLNSNNVNTSIKYTPVYNNYLGGIYGRYDGLRNEEVHVECGPNSRPLSSNADWSRNIRFSETSFHSTGIKLLMKKSVADQLPNRGSVISRLIANDIEVLVPANTTTENELKSFSGIRVTSGARRDDLLDRLERGENRAFASDALIIKTLWNDGVEPLDDQSDTVNRKVRLSYRSNGYSIYPTSENYLLEDKEEYVIAIKSTTAYSDSLMQAVEQALTSDRMREEGQKLRRAELLRAEEDVTLNRWQGTLFQSEWIVILVVAVLALLLVLIYVQTQKRQQVSGRALFPGQRKNGQGDDWHGGGREIHINIDNSPQVIGSNQQEGSGHSMQLMSPVQEQAEMADEIRHLLNDIAASTKNHRERQARAAEVGETMSRQSSTLTRRLADAIEKGTISAIESAIDHPLAAFFIDSFKAFRESENK